jgi:hypothetical protein
MDSSLNVSQWIRVGMRVMHIRGAFIGGESRLPSLAVGTVSCTCDVRRSPFSSSCPAEWALLAGCNSLDLGTASPSARMWGEQG